MNKYLAILFIFFFFSISLAQFEDFENIIPWTPDTESSAAKEIQNCMYNAVVKGSCAPVYRFMGTGDTELNGQKMDYEKLQAYIEELHIKFKGRYGKMKICIIDENETATLQKTAPADKKDDDTIIITVKKSEGKMVVNKLESPIITKKGSVKSCMKK